MAQGKIYTGENVHAYYYEDEEPEHKPFVPFRNNHDEDGWADIINGKMPRVRHSQSAPKDAIDMYLV